MKKSFAKVTVWLIIFIFILEGIGVNKIVTNAQTNELVISLADQTSKDETKILIQNNSQKTLNSLSINLPKDSQFDETKTQLLNPLLEFTLIEEKITITSEVEKSEEIVIVLKNLSTINYTISAQGTYDGGNITSEPFSFKVQQELLATKETSTSQPATETEGLAAEESEARDEPIASKALETSSINADNSNLDEPNVELLMSSLSPEVMSGKVTNFQMVFKVTGSRTEYSNIELVVNLPNNVDLPVEYEQIQNNVVADSLDINGVKPIYNEINQTLTYKFDTLPTGQVYKNIIKVTPVNGLTPFSDKTNHIRHLTMSATVNNDETGQTINSEVVKSQVLSDTAVVMSKTFDGTKRYNTDTKKFDALTKDLPTRNDLIFWKIKIAVPKKNTGQSYLAENSEITVVDTLPAEVSFSTDQQVDGFDGVYDATSNTVKWTFVAPTLEEQKNMTGDNLFEKEMTIVLRVKNTIGEGPLHTTTNRVTSEVEPLGATVKRKGNASSKVKISDSTGISNGATGAYYFSHYRGASNGTGSIQGDANIGSIPKVTDSALISNEVGYSIAPRGNTVKVNGQNLSTDYPYTEILTNGFKTHTTEMQIDSKLDLKSLHVETLYSLYREGIPGYDFKAYPDGFFQLKVNGVWQAEQPFKTELGVNLLENNKPEGHISAYRVTFKNASGEMHLKLGSKFDIYPGSVGIATNSVKIDMELNNTNKKISWTPVNSNANGPLITQYSDRKIEIVKVPVSPAIVKTAIEFVDQNNDKLISSNIERGLNRVKVEFENHSTSPENVKGPIELIAVLPKGVAYIPTTAEGMTFELLDDVNGQSRVKITFANSKLEKNRKLSAQFNVDVTREAPSTLDMQVYGYSQTPKYTSIDTDATVLTAAVVQTDTSDMNTNGNSTESRVKSANRYSIIQRDDLQIQKAVKGSLDDDYSLFGYTTSGGDVSYRFNLTNTTGEVIEKFMFLDVLPSYNDLGITDNVARGSQFETTLKGPIHFTNTKWENKVDVYYSASKNPKRDDLYESINSLSGAHTYVNPINAENPNWVLAEGVMDWANIHSFKIVMKPGVEWIEGQDVTFEIAAKAQEVAFNSPLLNQSIAVEDRAAWNSVAVTTNGLLAVEPTRVGVALKKETSRIQLKKIDEATGTTLAGAEFELWKCPSADASIKDCGDAAIATGTTDEFGKLVFENLELGEYKLVETKAPAGYRLLTAPISVTLDTTTVKIVEVENSKYTWELPDTGGQGTLTFYLVGLSLILLTLFMYFNRRKKSEV